MSRGPLPSKGLKAALPVANARGHVECFRRRRGSTADLMVSGSGVLAIVRVRYAERLSGTIPDVAVEFSDAIARLRTHPCGGPVSRELWLYSRHGMLRFFRVLDDGIMELGADGNVPGTEQEIPVIKAGITPSVGGIPAKVVHLLQEGVKGG